MPVRGQVVELTVQSDVANAGTRQVATYRTDISGRLSVQTALPACSGALISKLNYGPSGSPIDHWNGTAQNASVKVVLLGAVPVSPACATFSIPFTRICSETYLGYY
jgi:hypothetical protein